MTGNYTELRLVKNEPQKKEETTFCNMCGKPLDFWDVQEDFSLHRHLGYGTKNDGSVLDLQLCCDCIDNLIDECVISPIIDNT